MMVIKRLSTSRNQNQSQRVLLQVTLLTAAATGVLRFPQFSLP
jgi:hypothetical protein